MANALADLAAALRDLAGRLDPGGGVYPTKTSETFSIPNGKPFEKQLGFSARSCTIDNRTSSYLTPRESGRWVDPGVGAAFAFGATDVVHVDWTAPPGKNQIAPVAGEEAQVTFYSDAAPPGSGVTSTQPVNVPAFPNIVVNGTADFQGTVTIDSPNGQLVINWDQTHTVQTVYGAGVGTGLAAGNQFGPIKLEASQQQFINDVAHDYNIGMLVNQWTADGAGITVGNWARGDGIYVQATDNSGFVGPANALNVFAGTSAQQTTDNGAGGTVTYGATSLTDTSKNWVVNQWVGRYVVVGNFGLGAVVMYVSSNTATTLTGQFGWQSQVSAGQGALHAAATPAAGTAYVIPNSNATGINVQRYSSGNALKIVAMAGSGGGWPGMAIGSDYVVQIQSVAGVNSTVVGIADGGTSNDSLLLSSLSKTSGRFLDIFHSTSAFTGDAIFANIGAGGGSMAGNFIRLQRAGVDQFVVNAGGGAGFWGHAAPGAQPAAPVTLADVIAIIRGCGLSA